MGIAMSHFELSRRQIGIEGDWEMMDHGISGKEGVEYIVSRVQKPSERES